jgi:hypothetical protein
MNELNYNCHIGANVTAKEAFDAICRVSEWWATDISGSSLKADDVFTVRFSETSVTFKIIELVPNKKIVWLVTDCYLHWIKDKKEWKGTRINWEISAAKGSTLVSFTHIGLVPALECYNDCKEGWDFQVGKSLFKFLTAQKGMPDINTRTEKMNKSGTLGESRSAIN